jgi:hypothetical protein
VLQPPPVTTYPPNPIQTLLAPVTVLAFVCCCQTTASSGWKYTPVQAASQKLFRLETCSYRDLLRLISSKLCHVPLPRETLPSVRGYGIGIADEDMGCYRIYLQYSLAACHSDGTPETLSKGPLDLLIRIISYPWTARQIKEDTLTRRQRHVLSRACIILHVHLATLGS